MEEKNSWITKKQMDGVIPYFLKNGEIDFYMFDCFWESNKYVRYFEHKFDSYKNNKKKIYTYNKGYIFMEEPYKDVGKNEISYGFNRGVGKQVDEDTLKKYFKEITQNDFYFKQIDHIPTI